MQPSKISGPFIRIEILGGLLCALILALLVPLKISGLGYYPADDALRHVAHALDEKPWTSVLVLDPAIRPEMDSHPGWHSMLRVAHEYLGLGPDALITLSYVITFSLFVGVGATFSGTASAWLVACAALYAVDGGFFPRLLLGRPFAISTAVLVGLLFFWNNHQAASTVKKLTVGWIMLSIGIWAHPSAWYIWTAVFACLAAVGRWKDAIAGFASLLGALLTVTVLTGSFYNTVYYPIFHLLHALGRDSIRVTNLVGEFQPSGGPPILILVAAGFIAVRHLTDRKGQLQAQLLSPDLMIFFLMWILGLINLRFYVDWSIPAFLVWLTRQIGDVIQKRSANRPAFLAVTLLSTAILFLGVSADQGGRYTSSLSSVILTKPLEEIGTILPEPGGIAYSTDMQFFYRMYYRFPRADVRYVLGFEPGMMAEDDFITFRKVQTSEGALEAYRGWFDKMTPKDRIVLYMGSQPVWPGFQFDRFYSSWIGRKVETPPQEAASVEAPAT